jgi:ribonuclease Z
MTKRLRLSAWPMVAALVTGDAAAAFEGIRMTLLGTGLPHAGRAAAGPSILIEAAEEVLLVDCGRDTVRQLHQAGVATTDITGVFLTSLDPEHVAGCAELWRNRASFYDVGVWGPQGVEELVSQWEGDIRGRDARRSSHVHVITDNLVYQTDQVTVTAVVVDYPPMLHAYAYRVDSHERAVAVSGNTRYSENLARYTRGVHVLVHEVAAFDSQALESADARVVAGAHSTPEDAARVFRLARPGLAIYSDIMLSGVSEEELVRRTRRGYRGALEVGRDLMVIEIQNEVQIRFVAPDALRETQ